LIAKSTLIPENDVEWMVWYSDTPLVITPIKAQGAPFFPPDPMTEGFLEEYVTSDALRYLQTIHEEVHKCDNDGRTQEILTQFECRHPGTLETLGVAIERVNGSHVRSANELQATEGTDATQFVLTSTSPSPFNVRPIEAAGAGAEQLAATMLTVTAGYGGIITGGTELSDTSTDGRDNSNDGRDQAGNKELNEAELKSVLAAVVDENAVAILNVANTSKSADERMRMIYAIDNRVLGWTSDKWAQVLRVSDSAVRQTDWWRSGRKRLQDERD
jgi:hypothetical protein